MEEEKFDVVIFLIITTGLTLVLAGLIVTLIYLYQKKQLLYLQNIESLKLDHEKTLLSTQLDIQEETFQQISREIHDNISLSLTLAKLHLNTLDLEDAEKTTMQINASIKLISESILNLSDISKSLNSDIVISQGLITAVKKEVEKLAETGVFKIEFHLTGEPVYLSVEKELIIFRIIQEAFNNIIKHAKASVVNIFLHYEPKKVKIAISDNGVGFVLAHPGENGKLGKAGLKNMEDRSRMLNGVMNVATGPNSGTQLNFHIPY